jgi:hypothetical protein
LVLSVDTEKKRISFGLKPSYFFDEDLQDESQEAVDEAEELDDEIVHEADQQDDEMEDPDDENSVDEEVSLGVQIFMNQTHQFQRYWSYQGSKRQLPARRVVQRNREPYPC